MKSPKYVIEMKLNGSWVSRQLDFLCLGPNMPLLIRKFYCSSKKPERILPFNVMLSCSNSVHGSKFYQLEEQWGYNE